MREKAKEYLKLEEEISNLRETTKNLILKQVKLGDELEKFIIKKELYGNLSELEKYEGCDIERIDLIEVEGEDWKSWIDTFYGDEILEIKEGKIYYSSYEGGILSWDKVSNCYVRSYLGTSENKKILGFLNLRLDGYKGSYNSYNKLDIIKSLGE